MKVHINKIKLKNRIREDMGDIDSLKESITTYGLLNPIIINHKNELLAGHRRLESCKSLGWEEIDVTVVTTKSELDELEIESHENLMRKDFTESEIDKIINKKRKLTKKGFFSTIGRFFKKLFAKLFGKKETVSSLNN